MFLTVIEECDRLSIAQSNATLCSVYIYRYVYNFCNFYTVLNMIFMRFDVVTFAFILFVLKDCCKPVEYPKPVVRKSSTLSQVIIISADTRHLKRVRYKDRQKKKRIHCNGATGVQTLPYSKYIFSLQWNSFVLFYVLFKLLRRRKHFYASYGVYATAIW